jgi:hypothetical protein
MPTAGTSKALFPGLIFNEQGEPTEVAYIGDEPQYVILDAGFRRHVPAEYVDRQVLDWLRQQIQANRDLVTQGALSMLGQDDLFTKALIDASIEHMDDEVMKQGIPEDALAWLGMFGFRITVNVHGDVVEINAPAAGESE